MNRKGLLHEITSPAFDLLKIEKVLGNDEFLCYLDFTDVFKKQNPPIKLKINNEENKLIINSTGNLASNLFLLICGIPIVFWAFHNNSWDNIESIIQGVLFLSIGTPMLIHVVLHPKTTFVFDRLKGTLTHPDLINRKRTIPFNKVICACIGTGSPPRKAGSRPGYFLAIVHKNKLTSSSLFFTDRNTIDSCWSFLVWYMDRNRPLPPGNAFTEEHRKQDYERRKAEGFLPPLYPSNITIREDFSNVQSRARRKRKGER